MYPAALTLAVNTEPESNDTYIHRSAATRYVRKEDIPRLRRICSERLVEFSESIDDLFVAYETLYEQEKSAEKGQAVGVGLFYFEEDKAHSDVFR